MKKNFASTTLVCLTAWLFFTNFNLPGNFGSRFSAGKCSQNKEMASEAYRIKKVVLDAGHGGKDPGCLGENSREKHNALAIVLRLGELIQANFPEIQVVYTRSTDVFIPLNERAAIANRENADLFVSIHCNSVGAKHIKGTETYVLGLHQAQHNLDVAKRENSAIFYEENYQKTYDGYDPNSSESHIFSALWQSAYLEQSILLASFVQKFANEICGRKDMGVKQAGFLVLKETAMPSVLIETGYLTNREDEEFLASDEGRQQMAESIFSAFRSYKNQIEGIENQAVASEKPQHPVSKTSPGGAKKVSNLSPNIKKSESVGSQNVENGATLLKKTETSKQAQKTQTGGKAEQNSTPQISGTRILLTVSAKKLDLSSEQFNLLSKVSVEKHGNEYHYFTDTFASRKEAEAALPEIKNMGFKKAEIK